MSSMETRPIQYLFGKDIIFILSYASLLETLGVVAIKLTNGTVF